MFHITRDKEHNVEDDLRRIDDLDLPGNTRGYYVVVPPGDVESEIKVPKAYLGTEGEKKPTNKVFQVFNYPIPIGELFPDNQSGYA